MSIESWRKGRVEITLAVVAATLVSVRILGRHGGSRLSKIEEVFEILQAAMIVCESVSSI